MDKVITDLTPNDIVSTPQSAVATNEGNGGIVLGDGDKLSLDGPNASVVRAGEHDTVVDLQEQLEIPAHAWSTTQKLGQVASAEAKPQL